MRLKTGTPIPWETFKPILVALHFNVFELNARTARTDRRMNGQARPVMRPIRTTALIH